MKHCKKCGAQKAETDYYARDRTCKECRKAAVRANYAGNREHYREYERASNTISNLRTQLVWVAGQLLVNIEPKQVAS